MYRSKLRWKILFHRMVPICSVIQVKLHTDKLYLMFLALSDLHQMTFQACVFPLCLSKFMDTGLNIRVTNFYFNF